MLGLAEYTAFKAEMNQLANYYSNKVEEATVGLSKFERIERATTIYTEYHHVLKKLMLRTLIEVATHNLDYHYDGQAPDGLAEKLVDDIAKESYYGASFNQRMYVQLRRLRRSVASWGGAHNKIDQGPLDPLTDHNIVANRLVRNDSSYQRVFLGTALKLEQNITVHTARDKDIPFIRWSLSHKHKVQDVCDDLANNIDKRVVAKIKELDLNINPKGLYLVDQLPHPPHPNCQCEYMPEAGLSTRERRVRRTLQRIRTLLRRIRRK